MGVKKLMSYIGGDCRYTLMSNPNKKLPTVTKFVNDIYFADDTKLIGTTEIGAQMMLDIFDSIIVAYGQECSIKKTEVSIVVPKQCGLKPAMDKTAPIKEVKKGEWKTPFKSFEEMYNDFLVKGAIARKSKNELIGPRMKNGEFFYSWCPQIYLGGKKLQDIRNFKYVGSTENRFANMDVEIRVRVQRMIIAFNKLEARIFQNQCLMMKVKLRFLMLSSYPTVYMHVVDGIHGKSILSNLKRHNFNF